MYYPRLLLWIYNSMMKNLKLVSTLILLVSISITTGCSTLSSTDDTSRQLSSDPLVGVNRAIYGFNKTADKVVLKPVSKAYNYVVPKPAKNSIGNFFNNLAEPLNIVNNALQGKGSRALDSTYRFLINSSIGMLGLFDVATHYKIEPAREDLGQTLATWGVKPGPYIMLPFLGPSNLRDGLGRLTQGVAYYPPAPNVIFDSDGLQIGLTVIDAVDTRASLLPLDAALESQVDQYTFIKSAYESNRIDRIYDGDAPTKEEELDF